MDYSDLLENFVCSKTISRLNEVLLRSQLLNEMLQWDSKGRNNFSYRVTFNIYHSLFFLDNRYDEKYFTNKILQFGSTKLYGADYLLVFNEKLFARWLSMEKPPCQDEFHSWAARHRKNFFPCSLFSPKPLAITSAEMLHARKISLHQHPAI